MAQQEIFKKGKRHNFHIFSSVFFFAEQIWSWLKSKKAVWNPATCFPGNFWKCACCNGYFSAFWIFFRHILFKFFNPNFECFAKYDAFLQKCWGTVYCHHAVLYTYSQFCMQTVLTVCSSAYILAHLHLCYKLWPKRWHSVCFVGCMHRHSASALSRAFLRANGLDRGFFAGSVYWYCYN